MNKKTAAMSITFPICCITNLQCRTFNVSTYNLYMDYMQHRWGHRSLSTDPHQLCSLNNAPSTVRICLRSKELGQAEVYILPKSVTHRQAFLGGSQDIFCLRHMCKNSLFLLFRMQILILILEEYTPLGVGLE